MAVIAGFFIVAVSSRQIGKFFTRIKFPLISGFLFTGMIAGPYILNLIPAEAVEKLRFVDKIALAFIAFAAGSELYLDELKTRMCSIKWVTIGIVFSTFVLGSTAIFFLTDYLPFFHKLSFNGRLAVSLLAGAVLTARSPSSAIAIVNELRARGPFTCTVLGVTVIMDVVVIVLFAINSSFADTLLTDADFRFILLAFLAGEVLFAFLLGYVLGKLLTLIMNMRTRTLFKAVALLASGYGVFLFSEFIRHYSADTINVEILLEPLLICMVAGFVVTNFSTCRLEFLKIIKDAGPPVYVAFFTLTGASLSLNILVKAWPVALTLFFVRLVGIFIGSFTGGMIAGDPVKHNKISWMAYVTQAGVGLGLAKQVAVEFPEWGPAFSTVIIAVIVLNQIIGPPFFKWAINIVGESHLKAETSEFEEDNNAFIFGVENQSLALARQLCNHGWKVRIAAFNQELPPKIDHPCLEFVTINSLDLNTLNLVEAHHAEVIVTMLSDEENYLICELAFENFGTKNIVVRLNNRCNLDAFREIGALIVEPSTAIVSLMDHLVRSPVVASLLLGVEDDQEIIDIEITNPNLDDMALRDLRLPIDTLILSISRNDHMIISHGYTTLRLGDIISIMGSVDSLQEVQRRFES